MRNGPGQRRQGLRCRLCRVVRPSLLAALALVVAALTGACTGHADDAPGPRWREASLPLPPGAPGRLAVRAATRCADRWYVVGGVLLDRPTQDQDSRPAAWSSGDGLTWTPLPIDAHTFWGQRAILSSVACGQGTIAVVGARSGGAHGNPRVTTFFQDTAGLHDVTAPFSQYGGEQATNVGPIAGGDAGWLITGNRTSGPAVWFSPTGETFELEEDVPGLANDDEHDALAQAAMWDGAAWTVVGGTRTRGSLNREPAVWTSTDGRAWGSDDTVEGSPDFDDLERVLTTDDGEALALGISGSAFRTWHRDGPTWRAGREFGRFPKDGGASPFVASAASSDGGVWATTSDGSRYALWHSADGDRWARVDIPVRPATAGDHTLAVAAADDGLVLVADDGARGRVWTAS